MKMLGKLASHWQRAMSARPARRKKERKAVWRRIMPRNAWSATLFGRKQSGCVHRDPLSEKALAKAELERDVAREMLIERSTPIATRPGALV